MLAKKFVLLAGTAAALTASAAFADYYDAHGRYHPYNNSYSERVVEPYPAYPSYYYAPAPVYSAPAYSYEPAPSYYYSPAPSYYYAPSGAATGAVAGAIIGGSIDRHHRAEGAVAGALLGGVIGSQYDRYSY